MAVVQEFFFSAQCLRAERQRISYSVVNASILS